jgi:hypothetical protein
MSEAHVELTREELYRLVWKSPLSTLASRFGISDVGLKKVCVKHDIPVPGRGYWAKVHSGTKPRMPLPKRKNAGLIRIHGRQTAKRMPIKTDELERWRAFEARAENRIRVMHRINNLHPIAQAVERTLEKAEPNHDGLLECLGESLMWVRVTPKNVKRAVLIVDGLVRGALKRECKLRPPQPRNGRWGQEQAALVVEGEPVTFRLADRLRRIEVIPTRDEQRRWEEDAGLRLLELRRTKLVPAGGMKLVLCTFGWSEAQRTWTDTDNLVLEDRLNEVMLELREYAERERRKRAERDEWHRRREEEQRRAHEEHGRRELEDRRVRDLLEESAAWARARDLLAYLDELEAEAKRTGQRLEGGELGEWIAWARAQAQRISPLPGRLTRSADSPDRNRARPSGSAGDNARPRSKEVSALGLEAERDPSPVIPCPCFGSFPCGRAR